MTFSVWYAYERTLSIHTIVTTRREAFYWLAVLFTFALGTAAGDLTAERLGIGYWQSALMFGGMIARRLRGARALRAQRDPRLLDRVHPHAAARRLDRRLPLAAARPTAGSASARRSRAWSSCSRSSASSSSSRSRSATGSKSTTGPSRPRAARPRAHPRRRQQDGRDAGARRGGARARGDRAGGVRHARARTPRTSPSTGRVRTRTRESACSRSRCRR